MLLRIQGMIRLRKEQISGGCVVLNVRNLASNFKQQPTRREKYKVRKYENSAQSRAKS